MDYGGWYELKDKTHIFLEDVIFITAMTPTSGSNMVT